MKAVADLEAANLATEQALKQANERATKSHGDLAAANDELTSQLKGEKKGVFISIHRVVHFYCCFLSLSSLLAH